MASFSIIEAKPYHCGQIVRNLRILGMAMDNGTIALAILGMLGLLGLAIVLLAIAASIPYDHR